MADPKSTNRGDNEANKFVNNPENEVSVNVVSFDTETAVLANLKTLELLGINLDEFVVVGDEITSLTDGTLIKATL